MTAAVALIANSDTLRASKCCFPCCEPCRIFLEENKIIAWGFCFRSCKMLFSYHVRKHRQGVDWGLQWTSAFGWLLCGHQAAPALQLHKLLSCRVYLWPRWICNRSIMEVGKTARIIKSNQQPMTGSSLAASLAATSALFLNTSRDAQFACYFFTFPAHPKSKVFSVFAAASVCKHKAYILALSWWTCNLNSAFGWPHKCLHF